MSRRLGTIFSLCMLFLALATTAHARVRGQGECAQGNYTVNTGGNLSTTLVRRSFPSCTVSVFATGTLNLATIFSDNLGTPKSNPFTADSTGHWFFYADNGRYDVQLSGASIPSPFTLADIILTDPTVQSNTFVGTSFSSASTPVATSGVFNLASADIGLCWRNNANSADLCFTKNTSDVLNWPGTFNANAITTPSFSLTTLTVSGNSTLNGGTLNGTYAGNPTLSGTVTVSGALNAAAAKNIGGIQYAAQYAVGSTTCGVLEAYNALPANGGKIVLQQGNCSTSGWPVTITKPVVIEGQGMGGPNDPGTNANVIAGSSLTNTSTGNTMFVISLGAGTSVEGVTFKDFAMIGNKTVGGATAGDCVDINGGTTAQQVRAIAFENIQCNQPKGSGFVMQDNAFIISFNNVHVDQSGSHCYVIKTGPNVGTISQIHFIASVGDLCGGNNASSGPGTADGWNISGSNARTIDIIASTLADSNNGVNVVVGAINTNIHVTNSDFETNTTCDINLNDGFGHVIIGSTLLGTGVGARGVCTAMPVGAATQPNQLLMFGNNINSHTVQDVTIGANQKTGFILPQSANNYSYSDASGHVVKMDVNTFGALSITAGEVQPGANGVTPSGDPAANWSVVNTFATSFSEGAAPSGTAARDTCYGDSTAHNVRCSMNNGSFQNFPVTIALQSAYTNATTTFSSITDGTVTMSWPILAFQKYKLSCDFTWQGSVNTAGPKFQITGPAAPTVVGVNMDSAVTTTTSIYASATAFSSAVANSGTITATTNLPAQLTANITNGANAGTLVVQAAANGAGTLTIASGSCQLQ